METILTAAVSVAVLPIVAYFVAKFGAYGYLRGVERYRVDFKRRNLVQWEDEEWRRRKRRSHD
jgi:hypothetical protein